MIIGSIDIGTNTVLLLIAEVDENSRELVPLKEEYMIPRIGKNLQPGEDILPERINNLLNVLEDYDELIRGYDCAKVVVTATNAFRIASNAKDITEKIDKIFGWRVKVVSGDEEAELSFLGAGQALIGDFTKAVIDIGGGSTEIIIGKNEKINFMKSHPVGVVSLTESYIISYPPSKEEYKNINSKIRYTFQNLETKIKKLPLIAVAGTPTTLAAIKAGIKEFDSSIIEGSKLSLEDIIDISNELSRMNTKTIKQEYGEVAKGREDILLSGTLILKFLLELSETTEIVVSTKGIRYGAIIDFLKERNNN
jgi:exopolyphosphatase/guanosine-5'-triphosphate,3'-diphosphate pyrophosphatase